MPRGSTLTRSLAVTLCVFLVSACASNAVRTDRIASDFGLQRQIVKGSEFDHVVYLNESSQSAVLHIYLEGDGVPWLMRYLVNPDPTPRNPLMLRLMQQDPTNRIYLGRPCYHGLASSESCSPNLWTYARYGETVVESMSAALRRLLEQRDYTRLVFLGHSGGGALAMLLAERFAETEAVLTLAGNLDHLAWTKMHGYIPLGASLNPASRSVLKEDVYQLHVAGGRDRNIPAHIIRDFVGTQKNAELLVVEGFDHGCCYQRIWLELLNKLP